MISAADRLIGSFGFGSMSINIRPLIIVLIPSTGFQSSFRIFKPILPYKSILGW
jgi:hypothetical protein